jgi:hypothetical protein
MSAAHPLVRMLTAFDARVRDLCAVLGDASLELAPAGAADDAPADAHAQALRMQAARRIWFAAPVPLEAFIVPGNRIAIVAPELLRRLLAARALFACRDAVRRCVDRHTRRALLEGVGATAFAVLADTPATDGGAADELPDDTSPDALARRGWQLIAAEGDCLNPTLRNVVELSLASVSDESSQGADFTRLDTAQLGSVSSAGSTAAGRDEMNRFFTATGRMFPELQWLFG